MMSKVLAVLKFIGRWLGPLLIVLALVLFFMQPMPLADPTRMPALLGAIATAITCFLTRAPELRRRRAVLGLCALAAFGFWGWRHLENKRGYHEETVSFTNGDVRLAGTLYLPDHAGKAPGIVWIQGSGGAPRGYQHDNVLHFVQSGYVVLTYDKRGIGGSTGKNEAENFTSDHYILETLASDAAAGLSFLQTRPEVRAEASGFAGLSQGGFVAPRAALLNGHAAFFLGITTATTTIGQIVRDCKVQELRASGMTEEQAEAKVREMKLPDPQPQFDPKTSLRALNIPSLWVLGGSDGSVPPGSTIRDLDELKRLGKPYEYRVMPGAWHALIVGPKRLTLDTIDVWLARVTAAQQ